MVILTRRRRAGGAASPESCWRQLEFGQRVKGDALGGVGGAFGGVTKRGTRTRRHGADSLKAATP